MAGFIYGVDISSYQRSYNLNFNQWVDHGIDFVIVKGDQEPITEELWSRLSQSRIPVRGMYFWHYPLWNTAQQVATYSSAVATYKPDFIGLDIENWWVDYDEYDAALHGKIRLADVRRVASADLNKSARAVYNGIKGNFPDKYFLRYTAEWVVKEHCPDLNSWMNDGPNWIAMYPDLNESIRHLTWEELKQYPPVNVSPVYDKNVPNEVEGFKQFSADRFDMWQCSSRIIIPGEIDRLDIGVFNGTLAQLQKNCGLPEIPPLIPVDGQGDQVIAPVMTSRTEPPVVLPAGVLYKAQVTATWLTVCQQPDPNSTIQDWLPNGTMVEIRAESANGWGFFIDGQGHLGICTGWIKLSYTRQV